MSDAVDISREAVEHLASELTAGCAALDEHGEQRLDPLTAPVAVDPMVLLHASAMIRALRAALDAAEAERDKLRAILWARIRGENECVTECVYPEGGQCGCHEEMQALLAQQEPPRD